MLQRVERRTTWSAASAVLRTSMGIVLRVLFLVLLLLLLIRMVRTVLPLGATVDLVAAAKPGAGPAPRLEARPLRGTTTADTITLAMIALGDSIYHGRVAGAICATCHGPDANGVAGLGPNLRDTTWLHGDGSFAFLTSVIRSGVARPKQSRSIMPPFGGVPLTDAQLRAVAAYVHSLSRPRP